MSLLNLDTPFRYYCGVDTRVYARNGVTDDSWVDEAYAIEWNVNAPAIPLYGYHDREVRAWTSGRMIVQGALVMNFRKRNELTLALTGDIESLLFRADKSVLSGTLAPADDQWLRRHLISYGTWLIERFYKLPIASSEKYIEMARREIDEQFGGTIFQPLVYLETRSQELRAADLADTAVQGSQVKAIRGELAMVRRYQGASDMTGSLLAVTDLSSQAIIDRNIEIRGEHRKTFEERGYKLETLDQFEDAILRAPESGNDATEIATYNNLSPWSVLDAYVGAFLVGDASFSAAAADPTGREELKNLYWRSAETQETNRNIVAPYDPQFLNGGISLILAIGQKDPIEDEFADSNPVDRITIKNVHFQGEQKRVSYAERDLIRVAYPFLASAID